MIQLIESAGFVALDQLLVNMVDVAVKSVVIVALAWFVCLCLRRSSASLRSFVWLLAIIALAVVPLIAFLRPNPAVLAVAIPETVSAKSHTSGISKQAADSPRSVYKPETPSIVLPSINDANPIQQTSRPVYVAPVTVDLPNDFIRSLIVIWFAGALFCLALFAHSVLGLRRIERKISIITSGREYDIFELCLTKTGSLTNIRLAAPLSPFSPPVPLTWGFSQPVVVLPASSAKWDERRLTASILHELAHVQRRDWASQLVASIICVAYWFNPLAWLALRQMRRECESASDDIAVTAGIVASEYAAHLLETAKEAANQRNAPSLSIAMVKTCRLERRLRAVLSSASSHRDATRASKIVAICAALVVSLLVGQYRFCFGSINPNRGMASDDSGQAGYLVGDGNDAIVAPNLYSKVILPNRAVVKLVGMADSQSAEAAGWPDSFPSGQNSRGARQLLFSRGFASWDARLGRLTTGSLKFTDLRPGEKGRAFRFEISYKLPSTVPDPLTMPNPVSPTAVVAQAIHQHQRFRGFYDDVMDYGVSTIYQYIPNEHLDEQYPTLDETVATARNETTDYLSYSEAFGINRKLARLRMAVAAGPFVDTAKMNPSGGSVISGSLRLTMKSSYSRKRSPIDGRSIVFVWDNLAVDHAKNAITDYDRRIICLDNKGRKLGMYKLTFIEAINHVFLANMAQVPNAVLKKTQTVDFVARPYYWVEFDNVKLDSSSIKKGI